MPLLQTTVVVLPGGTTTVVFAGGAGLELLMHPANIPAAIIKLINAFIDDSCAQSLGAFSGARVRQGSGQLRVAVSPGAYIQ